MDITYDFEGDDDDADEIERWRRGLHPVEKYPLLDDEDGNQTDKDCKNFGYPCFFATGTFCHFDHSQRCRKAYLLNRTNQNKRSRRQKS